MAEPSLRIDEFAFILLGGIILLAVFMMVPSAPPVEENVTVNVTPGGPKMLFFGDTEVFYSTGLEILDEKSNQEVSKGAFSTKTVTLTGFVSEFKLSLLEGGIITIEIEDTNNLGDLIIEVNGVEIYRGRPKAGEFITKEIDKGLIKQNNVIRIKTEYSNVIEFWKSSVYKIKSVKFGIKYTGISFKDFEFWLTSSELENIRAARLEFKSERKGESVPLIVKINKKELTKNIPEIFYEYDFGPLYNLREGKNRLIFSTEPGGHYLLKDITLTLFFKG